MTNRNSRFVLAVGLVAVLAASAVPVLVAQQDPGQGPGPGRQGGGPPHGGPVGPGGRMGPGGPMGLLGPGLRQLDLSEDQHQQVRAIMESHRDDFAPIGERMRAAHESMRALVEADTIDEQAIRAKSLEVAAVEADMAIMGARLRAEVFSILTPEQQQKAKELRATLQNRMQRMGGPASRRPGRRQAH